jgi:hypothetical protein
MQKTLLLGFLFFSLQTEAQSTVPAVTVTPATFNVGGGSSIINPSFMVDWSIGESTVIETFQGENPYPNSIVGTKWNVTCGILQPFDKNHIIFNDLIPYWTNQEIRVYPVPTPNTVFIDFRSSTTGKISIQLMTLDGRILGVKEFIQVNGYSTQSWNIKNQPSGAYYLRIILSTFDGKILKQGTFKIEKIQ